MFNLCMVLPSSIQYKRLLNLVETGALFSDISSLSDLSLSVLLCDIISYNMYGAIQHQFSLQKIPYQEMTVPHMLKMPRKHLQQPVPKMFPSSWKIFLNQHTVIPPQSLRLHHLYGVSGKDSGLEYRTGEPHRNLIRNINYELAFIHASTQIQQYYS